MILHNLIPARFHTLGEHSLLTLLRSTSSQCYEQRRTNRSEVAGVFRFKLALIAVLRKADLSCAGLIPDHWLCSASGQ